MSRWAVILAGGIGSRFWPLSTPARPKQLLPLVSDAPMLVDAVRRMGPIAQPECTLVLTNTALAAAVTEMLPMVPRANIIAESRPAGTAAALAWGARLIRERDAHDPVMVSVHADWAIGDEAGFQRTLIAAADLAASHAALVTVGIVPSRPDSGLGYIEPGDAMPAPGHAVVRRVARFVEKPSREVAVRFVAAGYLWNSGIFAWRAQDFLDEIARHTPEVAPALASARTADEFFQAVRSVSVDVGVLERSTRVLVLPGDFGWDDVGTWAALRRVRHLDAARNAVAGHVYARDTSESIAYAADGATVVLYGVSDLVVVARPGLTLVTTVERSQDLKRLLESLPAGVLDA